VLVFYVITHGFNQVFGANREMFHLHYDINLIGIDSLIGVVLS
jgi:hypothetical protein